MKGRAATAEEIYTTLKQGGYEFTGDDKYQLRGVSISLGKSRNDFVYVKSSNAFGLWEFYPEKMKERERQKQSKEGIEVQESANAQDEQDAEVSHSILKKRMKEEAERPSKETETPKG